MRPTIVLVHGAFAESASWDRVIDPLVAEGHRVIAAANPLRGLAADAGQITGLVYVNGFAPDAGENCFQLAAMFPGSTLGEATVKPVPRSDGTTDFYVASDPFHDIFCADVPAPQAALMAATQRPATQEALVEPSGERPLWKELPSCFLIGGEDRIIPAALQHFMAHRAGARRTVELPTASHAAAVSHPDATGRLILEAVTPLRAAA